MVKIDKKLQFLLFDRKSCTALHLVLLPLAFGDFKVVKHVGPDLPGPLCYCNFLNVDLAVIYIIILGGQLIINLSIKDL